MPNGNGHSRTIKCGEYLD